MPAGEVEEKQKKKTRIDLSFIAAYGIRRGKVKIDGCINIERANIIGFPGAFVNGCLYQECNWNDGWKIYICLVLINFIGVLSSIDLFNF